MSEHAEFLYSPAAVRAMDARAIGELGIPGLTLMERAGRGAFEALRRRWAGLGRLAVVCGVGNNAGDGYVVARLAREAGLAVEVLQLGDQARLQGDAGLALQRWLNAGGQVQPFAAARLQSAELVVDAIFGTGLDRAVRGEWAQAIAVINALGRPVLALDIPSGLHGGTGAVLEQAVRAAATITFIAPKCGLYTGAGPACTGEVLVDDLGVPDAVRASQPPMARLLHGSDLAKLLPSRPRDAHKGLFGHVLILGGDHGFGGAARMAAEAAARVGAGLVSVATRAEHVPALLGPRPELMVSAVAGARDLPPLLARASVVAVGPGLGQAAWGRELLEAALGFAGPLVVDADGLNLLAAAPRRRSNWVLTPHPGEAARLLGKATGAVQADRLEAARQLAGRYGGVVVLKGAGSIVQGEGGLPLISSAGNPGMASGGMGDVLTGVVAGLLAQGLEPAQAAATAMQVHALAADAAAADGERGLLASDLMPHLRRLVNPA